MSTEVALVAPATSRGGGGDGNVDVTVGVVAVCSPISVTRTSGKGGSPPRRRPLRQSPRLDHKDNVSSTDGHDRAFSTSHADGVRVALEPWRRSSVIGPSRGAAATARGTAVPAEPSRRASVGGVKRRSEEVFGAGDDGRSDWDTGGSRGRVERRGISDGSGPQRDTGSPPIATVAAASWDVSLSSALATRLRSPSRAAPSRAPTGSVPSNAAFADGGSASSAGVSTIAIGSTTCLLSLPPSAVRSAVGSGEVSSGPALLPTPAVSSAPLLRLDSQWTRTTTRAIDAVDADRGTDRARRRDSDSGNAGKKDARWANGTDHVVATSRVPARGTLLNTDVARERDRQRERERERERSPCALLRHATSRDPGYVSNKERDERVLPRHSDRQSDHDRHTDRHSDHDRHSDRDRDRDRHSDRDRGRGSGAVGSVVAIGSVRASEGEVLWSRGERVVVDARSSTAATHTTLRSDRKLATSVLVGDLPPRFSLTELVRLMGTVGDVVKTASVHDDQDVAVWYQDPSGATKAKRMLNNARFCGVRITVDIYRHAT